MELGQDSSSEPSISILKVMEVPDRAADVLSKSKQMPDGD
jgi:hypothetical protein